MAITVNEVTGVVYIPKADMTLSSSSPYDVYDIDLQDLHEDLRAWGDTVAGRARSITHSYDPESTLLGTIFGLKFILNDPYTITFENGNYAANIIGGNSNIAAKTNLNNVSVRPNNSAGLQTVITGSAVTSEDKTDIAREVAEREYEGGLDLEGMLRVILAATAGSSAGAGTSTLEYLSRDGNTTRIRSTFDLDGNRVIQVIDGS